MINYKNMGLYYKMVKAYIESFKDVKIILFEDFIYNTNKSVNDCFDFLKIKNMNVMPKEKVNVGGRKWSNNFYIISKIFFNVSNCLFKKIKIEN